MSHMNEARAQLVNDVQTLVNDTEELMRAVSADAKDSISTLRPRVEAAIRRTRAQASEFQAMANASVRSAAARVDAAAHQHPWQTAGIAAACGAALGAVIGVLLIRR